PGKLTGPFSLERAVSDQRISGQRRRALFRGTQRNGRRGREREPGIEGIQEPAAAEARDRNSSGAQRFASALLLKTNQWERAPGLQVAACRATQTRRTPCEGRYSKRRAGKGGNGIGSDRIEKSREG